MVWWKRLIFGIVSMLFGWFSLDYLIYAFRLLTDADNKTGSYSADGDGLKQRIGAVMFIGYFLLCTLYGYLIKRVTGEFPIPIQDEDTGKHKVKNKWLELFLQAVIMLTAGVLRFSYILFLYLPSLG